MKIMTLPCDGIGPEIMAATLQVVHAANDSFDLRMTFHEEISGFDSLRAHGVTLRNAVLEQARTAFDGVILGTQSHMDYPPRGRGGGNVSAGFRTGLVRAGGIDQCQRGNRSVSCAGPARVCP